MVRHAPITGFATASDNVTQISDLSDPGQGQNGRGPGMEALTPAT
jgi:hypothetical protein